MYADSLAGGSLAGGSLARKTEKGTKRTLSCYQKNSCHVCGAANILPKLL
jgi:hypothetical protein